MCTGHRQHLLANVTYIVYFPFKDSPILVHEDQKQPSFTLCTIFPRFSFIHCVSKRMDIVGLINQLTNLNINSTKINTLFGIPLENNFPVTQAINTCLVIARQYIYACRCLNKLPNFQELLEKIKFYKMIEYKIALRGIMWETQVACETTMWHFFKACMVFLCSIVSRVPKKNYNPPLF